MTDRIRPVDLLVAGYNLVLLAVWLRLAGQAWYVPLLGGLHAAAAGAPFLPWARRRGRSDGAEFGAFVLWRELYPLLCLAAFWSELGLLHRLAPGAAYDAQVSRMDLAIFGQHFNLIWMPAMPSLVLSEVMHLSYFLYYPLVFLPPLLMVLARRLDAARDMTLRLMATYLACYLWYLAFPVIGPAELLPHYEGPLTHGLFYGPTHAARAAGDSLGTAFPSSHVAGATTVAVLAWRWLSKPAALLVTVQAAGVLCATVYTQNHYPVDSLAGLVWALGVQLVLVPATQRVPDTRPVPVLPVYPATITTGSGA
jgi:membrane-associated phospholipid phosphatase